MIENQTTEFKREYTDDIKYAVIAFANCEGGKVYVGMNDDGEAYGIRDVDDTMLRLSNMIRGAIRPDVSMFVKIDAVKSGDKDVIEIDVKRGTSRPYYVAGKGIRPEGVYMRLGAASVPASDTAILNMIRETSGDRYEDALSVRQDLTFEYAAQYFEKNKLKFAPEQQRTLNVIGEDGLYTNLGYLLSDQCSHMVKLAIFQDDDKMIFKDRKEVSGSLLQQFDDVCSFIDRYNRLHAEFKGMVRIDNLDYPVEALRESILNAIVHRDYSQSAATLVSIFDDRVEILNYGGLVRGVQYDDILLGISALRNPRLANIFYRLKLIEAYGTGVMKINKCYENVSRKPDIQISSNAFKMILPNTNYRNIVSNIPENPQMASVLKELQIKGKMNRRGIQEFLNVSQTRAIVLLKEMINCGMIKRIGAGKSAYYVANGNNAS